MHFHSITFLSYSHVQWRRHIHNASIIEHMPIFKFTLISCIFTACHRMLHGVCSALLPRGKYTLEVSDHSKQVPMVKIPLN